MVEKMELSELIARLEKATGPDDDLDREILLACGWTDTDDYLKRWIDPQGVRHLYDICPTSSIDSALQLVPEGWERQSIKTGALKYTTGKHFKFECREPSEYGWTQGPTVFRGDHDVEPIAVCIAALRSREKTESGNG